MIQIPTLETERLRLVAPSSDALSQEREFWVSKRSHFVGGPVPEHRVWRILGLQLGHWALRGYGNFFMQDKASDAYIGMVGLWNPEPWPEAEMGYHIYADYEGKGYVTEACQAVMHWNFNTLKRDRLISLIDPLNVPSQNVSKRMGGYNTGETFAFPEDGHLVDIWRYDPPQGAA